MPSEPLLPMADIQGDVIVGLPKRSERLLFFTIDDVAKFKTMLKAALAAEVFTSAETVLAQRERIAARKADGIETLIPTPGLNIAFTFAGLEALAVKGLDEAFKSTDAFRAGMAARSTVLNDPPSSEWDVLSDQAKLHGVFIVTGASPSQTANILSVHLSPCSAQGWKLLKEVTGIVRPQPVKGHEHFGFADGVSQPGIRGRKAARQFLTEQTSTDPDQGAPGQDCLWPGEFLFGFPGQNPKAAHFGDQGPVKKAPVPFMEHGSFLVFRKLAQLVPEFNQGIAAAAAAARTGKEMPNHELLAAQVVGRWKSGASLIKAPTADDPSIGDGTPNVNDFEFGGDREGLDCPFAAHVRKVYPRNDVPGKVTPTQAESNKAEAFTQSHRMLRRGIAYGPELTEDEARHGKTKHDRGLLFLCYVTSIEDQFEFVQQSWADAPDFTQAGAGVDSIIGQMPSGASPLRPFLAAAPISRTVSKKPSFDFQPWVVMKGGAYLFAPSLDELGKL